MPRDQGVSISRAPGRWGIFPQCIWSGWRVMVSQSSTTSRKGRGWPEERAKVSEGALLSVRRAAAARKAAVTSSM